MRSYEMFSCTFSPKSVLSRAHTKNTQFTINLPVICVYRLRFSSTIAHLNLAYSAANHIKNNLIPVGAGKEFISEKKSNVIGRTSSYSY